MQKTLRFRVIPLSALLTASLMGGCIKEDLSDCPPIVIPPEPGMIEVMVVTAYDWDTKQDFTVSGNVHDASLFFFNDNEMPTLIEGGYNSVPQELLGQERPMPQVVLDSIPKGEAVWISAWGNIETNFDVWAYPEWGDEIIQEFLYIEPSDEYPGFYEPPGEILFGLREIVPGEIVDTRLDRIETLPDGTKKLIHEIEITQLFSRLHLQVENLPEGTKAEDYYVILSEQNNGYDYTGSPYEGEQREMRVEDGVFNSEGFLVSSKPHNLVPSVDSDGVIDAESGMTLRLFRKAPTRAEGDIDLTGPVTKADYGDGDYIGLFQHMTTNVRIRFPETGDGRIEVTVKITPWHEVYQWSEWGK